ncbi:adhesion G protein-coupled receptor E1 isoform X5 [Chelonia mydas]|uniref:adhesion G protein-coupled receptor E1 isoform X5 n=1 Tax=Chelonia mydas TaxID=8469 RepID=UPI0018A1E741|nr:adhesion G protein-coupled receptor E1 isoform X5 [Chelonia mydas]
MADACAASSVCPAFATCENIPGSHRCACKRGFASSSGEQYFTDRKVKCKDIDECSRDPSPCGPNSVCTNKRGSYTCTCPPGYLPPSQPGIPFSCTDIDECLDLASCPASATCTNTPGSHFCTCNTGFASSSGEQRFTEPAAQCNDIDECSRDPSPCGPSSVCTNTVGSYACTCPPGYLPPSQPGIPFSCTDVDECAQNPAICGPNASCLNTPGSYTCQCSPGHLPSTPGPWVPGTTLCTDIDECLDLASCPASATCTNTPGNHFCTCNTGFASSSGEQRFTEPAAQCNDIDECSWDPSPCGPSSMCTNTLGSYTCTCSPGYLPPSQPGIPFSCTDVDECARKPAICGPNASCLNTPGSYTCQCSPGHLPSTPGPWVPGTTLCTDIDECLDLASCPASATCTNTPGSHFCTCNTGFASSSGEQRFTEPAAQCNDIDECSWDPSPCGPSSMCTNTVGSYACTCPPGYLPPSQPGIPFSCTDVDECARKPAICRPNASCLNTPGSYTCQCSPGHLPSTPGPWVPGTTLCTDIDECLDLASCPASATCTNTPGSHFCTCNTGFASSSGEQRFTEPGAQCNDIDECSRDPSPCGPSSVCTNTVGSYACTCPPGYLPPSQPGIPFSCTDVDECARKPAICGPNASCLNTPGSYTCQCSPGHLPSTPGPWVPGTTLCTDIDECLDLASCPASATCTNTPGSHFCTCNTGFASSSGEQRFTEPAAQCNDIDECSRDPSPCGPSSVCTNTVGSYACTCPPGYLPPSQPGIPFSCTDVDECARKPAICGPNASCLNTPGSYTCQCSPGHLPSTPGPWVPGTTLCTDIDECLDLASCPASATCTNTPGSHFCTCNTGFASSSGEQRFTEPAAQCNDIDECSRDPSPCGPSSVCTNTVGSYACTCPPGYLPPSQPGIPFSCTDVDECARKPAICGPNASCLNTPGSYTCQCSPGHLPSTPGPWVPGTTLCTDIDECLDLASCPASATCTNTPGSHFCTCNTGFASSSGEQRFTEPAAQCNDIDECSRDPSPCGPSSVCTNTVGSYACTCPPGYLPPSQPGIPFSCTDVDECARKPAICGPNASCLNTPGSYTCQCSPGHLPSTPGPWVPGTTLCTEVASNDPVRTCHNRRLDAAPGSSPDDAAFCTLLTSTFSVLGDPYERKDSTVSLVKAAAGFASILEQTPSWSNLSTEQLSTMATVFLQRVESVLLAAFANPTGKGNQTIQMEQLDVQTKVIEDGCPGKDSVISLEVKGETMKISCRTIQGTVAQARAGVAFASYMGMESILNGSFFHGQRATSVWMNSRVVSAVLTSQTKTDFPDPVNYTFQNLMPSSSPDQLICVSWEATAWRGSWSRAGCGVLHSNATHTTCSCNRVSNLAVLMASGEITAGFPLFLVSHVGLALSLLCLFLAILTFLLSRSIRNVNTSIHLQLCLCLFLADLLFLTAVDSPSHQLACSIIAGLLHYLFLACFAWMFLEAVVLFLTIRNLGVVNYFSTHSPKMRHLSLFGYGFPTLVVAVSAAVMPQGYGRQENCWLSMEKGFIWSFLGPVCVIIGINSVLFALTLWMLQRKLSRLNTDVSTLKNTRLLTFKAIAQVFILGCTWIFGLLQVGPAATVMAYLFTIINSLQGAFIFLVHCLLNRQVREEYKRWFTCKPKSYVSDVSMSTLATSSKAG